MSITFIAESSGSQDLLVSEGSTWSNRIRYVKRGDAATNKDHNGNFADKNSGTVNVLSDDMKKTAEPKLLFLKHPIIKNLDAELIAKKLDLTRQSRDEMCAKIEKDYREHFPFFFTNPELVSNFWFSFFL